MKRDERSERNIEEVLERSLPSVSKEQMELVRERILNYVQSDEAVEREDLMGEAAFCPPRGFDWRRFAVLTTAAALLLATIWIGAAWQSRGVYAVLKTPQGSLYRVSAGKTVPVEAGARIQAHEVVGSSGDSGAILALADGSGVEMRSKSELLLERAADGVRIRLRKGSVLVTATKQHNGHLYVQTRDVTVSVIGTVFLVNAEEEGSRVAVIEGEVRVRQGTTEKSLRPGEQVTTNPALPSPSVKDEVSWSKNADAHMALLQQSASPAAARGDGEVRLAFDVASIRPGSPSAGGGGRGSNGAYPPACGGSPPTIDPGRFAVTNATLYRLITMAYGKECASVEASESELLSGGPDWIRSDKFDIEALMPKGSPSYTRQQLSTGNAPNLQAMLQTLLADRFHLVMQHEARELPVYVLTLGKGPLKLVEWKDGEPTRYVVSTGLNANGQISTAIGGNKRSMAELAQQLMSITRRPVLDRTGIVGEFNYSFEFEPLDSPGVREMRATGRWTFVTGPSLFTALGMELGLELKAAREKVEVLLIERAEKPTEN